MPPMSKLVVVVGATGGQGGSVVKSLLNNPEWKIRGLTRNPNGSSAQALAAKGVDMVAADLNDFNSLQAAFEGAHAIFAVTNFLDPFPTKTPEECAEIETNQGINMARAASQVPTLQHYIWSTLPDSAEICGDDYFIPHFCSKAKVDKYIKRELPELWSKATLLQIPLYGDNFQYHVVTPHALVRTYQVLSARDNSADLGILTGFRNPRVNMSTWSPGLPKRRSPQSAPTKITSASSLRRYIPKDRAH